MQNHSVSMAIISHVKTDNPFVMRSKIRMRGGDNHGLKNNLQLVSPPRLKRPLFFDVLLGCANGSDTGLSGIIRR
ncbi:MULTISPECIES: hypothetical protein [Pirellulaceae]|uniref:hypothetical protein n=1 Tax=Pirellulaceae TaxID=2691357 RepID=UPI0011B03AA0|nr:MULTISPECIES: hypothetical protein [Pirellulaceae]